MKVLASPSSTGAETSEQAFLSLFPHRFDFIYASHPEPGTSPHWQTESRYPLSDRMISQGGNLYGVRFAAQTPYCLLDIDRKSPYHPATDPFAVARIAAALETIGLTRYFGITSSYSGGLHLYFPFTVPQSSWMVGTAVTTLLENNGFLVRSGYLEVFPNRRSYNPCGKPSLFNAHRLPLQHGSYLLNAAFEPIWTTQNRFVEQWNFCQQQNQLTQPTLQRIIKQTQYRQHQVSGKAAKFLNDLNTEIEAGWTGHGQTNYLLGRITLRLYIFHHFLEGNAPLEGEALVKKVVETAQTLPGYQDWCQHQHEIEQRAREWARSVENSHYFHYGISKKTEKSDPANQINWNQQQRETTRKRITQAIGELLERNELPVQTTARFKALIKLGIGGGSLYRHKDLWHPDHLLYSDLKQTNLLPDAGGNRLSELGSDVAETSLDSASGGNSTAGPGFAETDDVESVTFSVSLPSLSWVSRSLIWLLLFSSQSLLLFLPLQLRPP